MIRRAFFGMVSGALLVQTAALAASEPKTVDVGKLPKEIRTLHTCAPGDGKVELTQERYAKAVLFLVSCPPKERGAFQLQAVYVARDAKGTGAKRVSFEMPGPDGASAKLDMLPSALAARETFIKEGDPPHMVQTRNEPPWITGAWRPDDRPELCVVSGQWRVQGDKGELWLWEEAKDCPKDATPKYERKVDRKPPDLVTP
jgi:hypothetical protein